MRTLALALLTGGCNQVFGLDPPAPAPPVDATAVDDALDAALDAAVDAPPCTTETVCWQTGGAVTASCNDGPAVGACVPADWRYCGCGPNDRPSVFIETIAGNQRRVVVTHQADLQNVALELPGYCFGTTGTPCVLDRGSCAGSGVGVDVWNTDIPPGTYTIRVFAGDVGAPCFTDDGGYVLLTASVTVP